MIIATGARDNGQSHRALRWGSAIDDGQLTTDDSQLKSCAFVLCDMTPEKSSHCSHTCCPAAIRQASETKKMSPGAEVTILFRELYNPQGIYDDLMWEAQQLGVNFVRYPAGRIPAASDGEIAVYDELTGRAVHISCEQVVAWAPVHAEPETSRLAAMFHLPVDVNGFIPDMRLRLRPEERTERGVFVCGAAHFPCDAERATFQAYLAAARAIRHVGAEGITRRGPVAVVDAARCNGCGDCTRVCPFMAVEMRGQGNPEMAGGIPAGVASVDPLLCTGCGNCVSACPVQAAQMPCATSEQLYAQIHAALKGRGDAVYPAPRPPVLILACEWSGYSAAEIAGAQGMTYPASTRLIRVHCTGRLQPGLLLKALEMGATGVMVLGCEPGGCHYEQGNEYAAQVFQRAAALGGLMGMGDRLALRWVPPDDGAAFVQAVSEFVGKRSEMP